MNSLLIELPEQKVRKTTPFHVAPSHAVKPGTPLPAATFRDICPIMDKEIPGNTIVQSLPERCCSGDTLATLLQKCKNDKKRVIAQQLQKKIRDEIASATPTVKNDEKRVCGPLLIVHLSHGLGRKFVFGDWAFTALSPEN